MLVGQLALDAEQQIIAQTRQWLEQKAGDVAAYRQYLERWGDWRIRGRRETERAFLTGPVVTATVGLP